MDEIERKAWYECLALWKILSEMPDMYTIRSGHEFKQNILRRLGIGNRLFGCPLCQVYIESSICPIGDCTIGNGVGKAPCLNTPYRDWHGDIFGGVHSQEHAKEFYEFLSDKAKERGY